MQWLERMSLRRGWEVINPLTPNPPTVLTTHESISDTPVAQETSSGHKVENDVSNYPSDARSDGRRKHRETLPESRPSSRCRRGRCGQGLACIAHESLPARLDVANQGGSSSEDRAMPLWVKVRCSRQ